MENSKTISLVNFNLFLAATKVDVIDVSFTVDEILKGVVDKNFEAVDNFHGHIRTQHGRLP